MNNKGQVMGVFLLLVMGVIGLVVLSEFTTGFCNCTDATSNATLLNATAVDFNCKGDICEVTSLVCGDDVLTPHSLAIPGNYTRDECEITLETEALDGEDCQLTYSYEGDTYADGITGTIICMLPVFIALALLMIAVGWFALR